MRCVDVRFCIHLIEIEIENIPVWTGIIRIVLCDGNTGYILFCIRMRDQWNK